MKDHVRSGYMGKGEHEGLNLTELGGKWGNDGKRQRSSTTIIRPIGIACGRTTHIAPVCL